MRGIEAATLGADPRQRLPRRRRRWLFGLFIRNGSCRSQSDLLRARLLVVICCSSLVILGCAVGLLVLWDVESFADDSHWLYASFASWLVAPLALLRVTRSLPVAVSALCFGIFSNLLLVTSNLGGPSSPTFPSLAAVPVLAALLAGRGQGAFWSVAVIAAWSVFAGLEHAGFPFFDSSPPENRSLTRSIALIPTGATIFLAILIYETHNKRLRSELAQERSLFEYMAGHDPLTQIPNRRSFFQQLELSVARAQRGKHMLAVLMLDLNGFKPINDRFGHPAGDTVLKTVASRLREELRATDRVARLGGDEFGVILEDCQIRADVETVALKASESISRPMEIRGRQVSVSASIGVALLTEGETDPEDLVDQADHAMYRCKEEQGAKAVFSCDLPAHDPAPRDGS